MSSLAMVWMALGVGTMAPTPVRADAPAADRAAAAAREAARIDRNAEAAVLYQRAIALDRSRRQEWLWRLAEQMTWAGREKEAIPLFREALAAGLSGDDERWARLRYALALRRKHHFREALRQCDLLITRNPHDIEARMGRAEAFSWWDLRRAEATKEYEAVLRIDPGNQEARRNLAHVQNDRERHQEAEQRLTALLRDHPDDALGTLLLAESQVSNGRPDRAERTLHRFLDSRSETALDEGTLGDFRRRVNEIEFHGQPVVVTDFQVSHQTDRLTIATESVSQDVPLHEGRDAVGPRYQRYDYDPGQGQSSIVVNRPGVFGRHRFTDATELTGSLYADLIEPQGNQKKHTALTYDTYATLKPSDRYRFDIGSNRTTFDNIKSLSRGITGTYLTFSMDIRPEDKTRLTARANYGGYSDGNDRRWTQFEVERSVRFHPVFLIGARYTSFGFSKLLDNGYFNPNTYHSAVATLHLYGNRWGRFYFDFDGSYGREYSNPGGAKPYSSADAHLTYLVGKRLEIQGRYGYFSSREASSGGFARRTTGIYLRFVM